MRTHWICKLFGHKYVSRPMKQSGLSWSYMQVCPRCGDIRDPEDT